MVHYIAVNGTFVPKWQLSHLEQVVQTNTLQYVYQAVIGQIQQRERLFFFLVHMDIAIAIYLRLVGTRLAIL